MNSCKNDSIWIIRSSILGVSYRKGGRDRGREGWGGVG